MATAMTGFESRMKTPRSMTFAAWLSLLACLFLSIEGSAGLIVCYARSGHTAMEFVADKARCPVNAALDIAASSRPSPESWSNTIFSKGCCGPCVDVPVAGTGVTPSSSCGQQLQASQPLLFGNVSFMLTAAALMHVSPGTCSPELLTVDDASLAFIRSTILLI